MTGYMPDGHVSCPICLSRLNWNELPKWRFDADANAYVELQDSPQASPEQRQKQERDAAVRCPDPGNTVDEHYLPADYGRYGKPALIGFVGETRSGKSHLLAAMIGEIEGGALTIHGIKRSPVDLALHHRFLAERVWPLLDENKVLPPTDEGMVSFVDAYLMWHANGPKRAVALFDVAGGELTNVSDSKSFLDVADGLVFVIDPAQLREHGRGNRGSGDRAFQAVIDVLRKSDRLSEVSMTVVLNKADLVRFDDPITKWWLHPDATEIDAEQILRESADVYGYLQAQGAGAWVSPFDDCAKVTLHVASATGGAASRDSDAEVYPRGVSPRRVITPLVSLLAMTSVLTGEQAQKVGI
jgi:hypothetical protein